jgi:cell division protein FtsL
MIELLNLIVSALIIIVVAYHWRQLHMVKQKVLKEEEGQRKQEEPKLSQHEKDPIKGRVDS